MLLIDVGFSIAQSSLIGIVLGNAAGLVGALIARHAVERLGGYRVLMSLGLLNIAVVIFIAVLAADGLQKAEVVTLILYANFAVFAIFTAERALLMPLCAQGRQATELASFVSLEAIAFLIFGGAALSMLDKVGLPTLLVAAVVFAIGGLAFAMRGAGVSSAPR